MSLVSYSLYHLSRIWNSDNICIAYLVLTPFTIASKDNVETQIKFIISVVLLIILTLTYFSMKAYRLDLSLTWNKVLFAACVLLLYALVSTLIHGDYTEKNYFFKDKSFYRVIGPILKFIGIYFCYELLSENGFRRIWKYFYYSVFFSWLGLVFQFWTRPTSFDSMRLRSFFYDPNFYGLYLIFICSLSYLYFVKNADEKKRHLFIGTLSLLTLLLTFSRSCYIILGFLFLFAVATEKNKKLKIRLSTLLVVLSLLFSALTVHRLNQGTSSILDRSSFARMTLNFAGINMIKDNFLLGVGFENSRFLVRKYQDPRYPIVASHVTAIHNIYISLFSELGIIGIGSFLFILISLLVSLLKNIKNSLITDKTYFKACFIFLFSFTVFGLFFPQYLNYHIFWLAILLSLLTLKFQGGSVHSSGFTSKVANSIS